MIDAEQQAALNQLARGLVLVLQRGIAELPAPAQRMLDERLGQGCRIEFAVRLDPLELQCFIAQPDLEQRALLFHVDVGPLAEHLH